MKNYIYLPYDKAKPLIQEGDVLLFRGQKWYSFLIKRITQSLYSHTALASWHNGDNILEIVEFHLKTGGVSRNLENVVATHHKIIDVYRPSPRRYDLEYDLEYDNEVLVKVSDYDGKHS